jgi:4-diphosphocytidyl-2-C-methyl-D-erythritol kinase
MINDLEPPVLRRHPEIASLKSQLKDGGAIAAAMSGSGSAVFGLFRSRAAAAKVVRPLSRAGARVFLTRTITRAEHERRGRPILRRN